MRFGLDSETMVPIRAHHEVGSTFALRYVSRYTPKVITRAEASAYVAGGIDLAVVFEDAADNSLRGYDQGKADAAFALGQAREAGMPSNRPIFFAVDFDASPDLSRLEPYFVGVKVVMGADAGVYGGIDTLSYLRRAVGITWGWQTLAWSRGVIGECNLYQYGINGTVGGVGVDYNHALRTDFGQWRRPVAITVDPYHYRRFSHAEQSVVMEYDKLRRHGRLNRLRLEPVRAELMTLAKGLAGRAYRDGRVVRRGGKPVRVGLWTPWDRGWRFQQLVHRAQGQQLVR